MLALPRMNGRAAGNPQDQETKNDAVDQTQNGGILAKVDLPRKNVFVMQTPFRLRSCAELEARAESARGFSEGQIRQLRLCTRKERPRETSFSAAVAVARLAGGVQ